MTKTKTTTETKDETEVKTVPTKHAWSNGKHAECRECHGTERKHYSGGLCTRCYTEHRNQKLGLGLYNVETQSRKVERMDARIARLETELKDLKTRRKATVARVA